jgi:hypothetical protein
MAAFAVLVTVFVSAFVHVFTLGYEREDRPPERPILFMGFIFAVISAVFIVLFGLEVTK